MNVLNPQLLEFHPMNESSSLSNFSFVVMRVFFICKKLASSTLEMQSCCDFCGFQTKLHIWRKFGGRNLSCHKDPKVSKPGYLIHYNNSMKRKKLSELQTVTMFRPSGLVSAVGD